MRRTLPITLSTALTATLAVATLTACAAPTPGATPSSAATCVPTAPGAASESVTVTGDLGAAVTVDGDFPLEVTTTQRSVLIEGAGDPLEDGRTADLYYALYNGATGELIEDSHDLAADPLPFVFQTGTSVTGMESTLRCSTAGSRIVGVVPPVDGFGADGAPDVGLEAGQSLLLVIDVLSVETTASDSGSSGTTPEGPTELPSVSPWTTDVPVVDLSGTMPTITLPDAPAPTQLMLAVLEEGDGGIVPNPATVTVDYLGMNWETAEVFDSSYARGAAASFPTNGVIEGFAAAIVGQQVGSTVLVVIPPEYGYPGAVDESDPTSPTGRTLVFLVHIVSYE